MNHRFFCHPGYFGRWLCQAIDSGIAIVACENTMTAQKFVKANMNPSVTYLPAGVIQLMKR